MEDMEDNRSLQHLPIHRSVTESSVPPLSCCEPLQHVPAWKYSTRCELLEADAWIQTRTYLLHLHQVACICKPIGPRSMH